MRVFLEKLKQALEEVKVQEDTFNLALCKVSHNIIRGTMVGDGVSRAWRVSPS